MSQFNRFIASAVSIGFLMPAPASACTIISVTSVQKISDPKAERKARMHARKLCREASRNKARFLRQIEKGKFSDQRVWEYANLFAYEGDECAKDIPFAVSMLDAQLPSPIPLTADLGIIGYLYRLPADQLSSQRRKEVNGNYWLRAHGWERLPEGRNETEVRAFLLQPEHWKIAIRAFGGHKKRDEMVMAELTNPNSHKFDLLQATKFAGQQKYIAQKIKVATSVLDPRLGKPNYDAAERLLDWYSPYFNPGLEPEQLQQAKAGWIRIAQNRLSSDNLEVKARAIAILEIGDLNIDSKRAGLMLEPDIDNLVILEKWPENAPALESKRSLVDVFQRFRYPTRAFRERRGGRIQLSAWFGPDGSFKQLFVNSSSGFDDLDAATTKYWQRYFRPRFSQMKLNGYSGKNVLAPLPITEWYLTKNLPKWNVHVERDEGLFRIKTGYAEPRSGC